MYRYLFEEKCFDRVLEVNKKISPELQRKIKEILANTLEIEYEEVELLSYKKTEKGLELIFEAKKQINENFVFRVILNITESETTLISLETFISRVTPVHLAGPVVMEDLLYNIIQEFSKKSFYKDIMSEYKLKYEEVSKKLYEGLEILFGFEDNNTRPTKPNNDKQKTDKKVFEDNKRE